MAELDLGLGFPVRVNPPAGPVFVAAPPAAPSVQVVPVSGRRGPPGPELGEQEIDDAIAAYIAENPIADTHTERAFTSAATVWDWTHDLGFTPAVTVLTSDRTQIVGTVTVNTPARTRVEFYYPVAGVLALS